MPRAWKVRSGNSEIRTGRYYSGKLFRVNRSQPPALITEGQFLNPVVSGDGRWAVVTKANGNWYQPKEIARINLQNGKEFKVNLPPADNFYAVSFLSAHNKILLYRGAGRTMSPYETDSSQFTKRIDYEAAEESEEETVGQRNDNKNPSPKVPEYYLLDAATGAASQVKGEFRPLVQQTYRPYSRPITRTNFGRQSSMRKRKRRKSDVIILRDLSFSPFCKFPKSRSTVWTSGLTKKRRKSISSIKVICSHCRLERRHLDGTDCASNLKVSVNKFWFDETTNLI